VSNEAKKAPPFDVDAAIIEKMKKLRGLAELRKIQSEAIAKGLLKSNKNAVIIGPTSSGKTLVGEFAAMKELEEGKKVLYLVPLSQLAAEKESELSYLEQHYKRPDGGADEDENEEGNKNIHVMTFEQFYRKTIKNQSSLTGYSLAIVDEFHLLYEKLRGFNLEKALTLLKINKLRIVCLSATFHDKKEVADWLGAFVVEVADSERPTKIHHSVIDISQTKPKDQTGQVNKILLEEEKKPWIIFCSKRDATRTRALDARAITKGPKVISQAIKDQFQKLLERQLTPTEEELADCVANRTGFFHAGIDKKLKDFVFSFFMKGQIDFLFTTTSLAYGVNTPAKSVLLYDMYLKDGKENRSSPVPVYLYLQMAGRAGRIKGKGDGYSYIVVRNRTDLDREIPKYKAAKIERAISRITEDDCFRKCIIELIYGGHNQQRQIYEFFLATFYNFQSEREMAYFGGYDLKDIIAKHLKYLEDKKFIKSLGAPGYSLDDLGEVVAEYLFSTYEDHKLESFYQLDNYLLEKGKLVGDLKLVYKIATLFDGCRVTKLADEESEEIESFFMGKISRIGSEAYAAYSIINGWMNNLELRAMEQRFKVNSGEISSKADEIGKVLRVAKKIAAKKGLKIDKNFDDFIEQIDNGVTADEVPFVRIKGIGREVSRRLRDFCRVLNEEHDLKGSSMKDIMNKYCEKESAEKLKKLLIDEVPLIGESRAGKIVSLVEKAEIKVTEDHFQEEW
jgi:replicative superfamily II helicase